MADTENQTPRLESRVSSLETTVGDLKDQFTAHAHAVEGRFDRFGDLLDQINHRFQEAQRDQHAASRPQYIGLASVTVALVIAIVGFATLLASPIVSRQVKTEDAIIAITEKAYDRADKYGGAQAKIDSHEYWLRGLTDLEVDRNTRISRLEGQFEVIREQLNAVDQGGSRKWVTEKTKP